MSEAGASDAPIGWWARAWTGLKCAVVAPVVGSLVLYPWIDRHLVAALFSSGSFPRFPVVAEIVDRFLVILGLGYPIAGSLAFLVGIVFSRRLRRRPPWRRDLVFFAMVGATIPVVLWVIVDVAAVLYRDPSKPPLLVDSLGLYLASAVAGGCAGVASAWMCRPRAPRVPASR